MVYLLARYYEPVTGQFMSVDPKVATTDQPYSYADGNPIDNTDPTGQDAGTSGYRCEGNDYRWCHLDLHVYALHNGEQVQEIQLLIKTEPFYGSVNVRAMVNFPINKKHDIDSAGLSAYVLTSSDELAHLTRQLTLKDHVAHMKLQPRRGRSFEGKYITILYDLDVTCSICTPSEKGDSHRTAYAHCNGPGEKCKFDKK